MADKPTEHLDWVGDDDAAKFAAPSAAKRLQGWVASEKPPFQYFNWAWRLVDRWLQWAEEAIQKASSVHLGSADGRPEMSATRFDASINITNATWASVGPTGSGADNIWAALDLVPVGVAWIKLRVELIGQGGDAGMDEGFHVSARRTGSLTTTGTMIARCATQINAAGLGVAVTVVEATVPIDSARRFDLYWSSSFHGTSQCIISLVGYGF